MKLKSDLHLHTCDDRHDTISHSARELISTAAHKGFKVLSITNHDTFTFSHDIKHFAEDLGILLIPGIEKTIEGKHVLILNANHLSTSIRTFDDLRRAKQDGIFVIAPHPFFRFRVCLEDQLLEHVELFDAIEFSFFYSRMINFNRKAVQLAEESGLPLVGNSDCHILKYMGICHSLIRADCPTIEAAFNSIKQHKVHVVASPIPLPKLGFIHLEMCAKVSPKKTSDIKSRLTPFLEKIRA